MNRPTRSGTDASYAACTKFPATSVIPYFCAKMLKIFLKNLIK